MYYERATPKLTENIVMSTLLCCKCDSNNFVVITQAAMREVDSDGSGTMDFYEYLQVAMLLERKKGMSSHVVTSRV